MAPPTKSANFPNWGRVTAHPSIIPERVHYRLMARRPPGDEAATTFPTEAQTSQDPFAVARSRLLQDGGAEQLEQCRRPTWIWPRDRRIRRLVLLRDATCLKSNRSSPLSHLP